ncbi:MAG: acyloxyacyl hydrolase [Chlamydiia bacterium]|nr:acyloxyacyl hydrolase [Chlamydiia bacterium]
MLCAAYEGPPPDTVSFAMGAFDFYRDRHRTWEFDFEYKFFPNWIHSPIFEVRPVFGIMMTAQGAGYLSGGLDFDFVFDKHFVLAPGFSACFYWHGHGKNLGFPLEFRTGIEVGYQFDDYRRLGLHFYHLSNAGLGDRNPGEESLVFYYEIPVISGFPFFGSRN